MSEHHGAFVWYELMTTDTAAAETFYKPVVEWQAADSGMAGSPYTIFSAHETLVAGLLQMPDDARANGATVGWTGYIAVDDVDASAAAVKQAGGSIHRGPADLPGVGRFAVAADPQRATFVLFHSGTGPLPQPAPNTPGLAGWRELHAADWETAVGFYAGVFGWTKSDAIDMGPMGTYQLIACGGSVMGGMMTKPASVPRSSWLYYFNVGDIDAAATRVTQVGGQVVNGPLTVPGGSWILHGLDPQGAMFGLVAPPG